MSAQYTILITGCSTGIGHALAKTLHARGQRVIATARKLESLRDLTALGIVTRCLDINDAASRLALIDELAVLQLTPNMLINNAGYGAMGPLAEMPSATLAAQFETNVLSLVAMTQAVIPGMVAQKRGRIVNLGSVSGVLTTPFAGAYCATKAAVHALSDALRMELAPFGIDVIIVQPGGIQSEFGATASRDVQTRQAGLSLYAPLADAIAQRAGASQQQATPVQDFVDAMSDAILAPTAEPVVRLGHGSTLLPMVQRWLPVRLRDRVLSKRFGLAQWRP